MKDFLNEMTLVLANESEYGISIPRPNLLFKSKYGRKVENYLSEILSFVNKDKTVTFTSTNSEPHSYIEEFKTEIEKNMELRREFDGLIIVDLSNMDAGETYTYQFMEYLYDKYKTMPFIFSISTYQESLEWEMMLSNWFFVRMVSSPEFSVEEQVTFLKNYLQRQNEELSSEVREYFINWVQHHKWGENEEVYAQLRNIGNELIYKKYSSECTPVISIKDMQRVLEKKELDRRRINMIGFQI